MTQIKLSQIIDLWKKDKKQYVKKSTYSAYVLLVKNHLLPYFGDKYEVEESDVQKFVFEKLEQGLSQKTIMDILIVLKMILKFGVKHRYLSCREIEIKFPTQRENEGLEAVSYTHLTLPTNSLV